MLLTTANPTYTKTYEFDASDVPVYKRLYPLGKLLWGSLAGYIVLAGIYILLDNLTHQSVHQALYMGFAIIAASSALFVRLTIQKGMDNSRKAHMAELKAYATKMFPIFNDFTDGLENKDCYSAEPYYIQNYSDSDKWDFMAEHLVLEASEQVKKGKPLHVTEGGMSYRVYLNGVSTNDFVNLSTVLTEKTLTMKADFLPNDEGEDDNT